MTCVLDSAFFFSSGRRQSSYLGDWSSDVCSSDLRPHPAADDVAQAQAAQRIRRGLDLLEAILGGFVPPEDAGRGADPQRAGSIHVDIVDWHVGQTVCRAELLPAIDGEPEQAVRAGGPDRVRAVFGDRGDWP